MQSRFSYVGVAFGARIRVIQLAAFSLEQSASAPEEVVEGEEEEEEEEEVHRRCIAAIFALLLSSSLYPSRFVSVAITRQVLPASSSVLSFSSSLPFSRLALLYLSLSLRPVPLLIARFIRDPAGRISTSKGSPLFLRHDSSCAHVNAAETSRRDARGVFRRADTSAPRANQPQPAFLHFSDGLVVIEQLVRARFFIVFRSDVFDLQVRFRFRWYAIQPFRLDLLPTLLRVRLYILSDKLGTGLTYSNKI